MHPGELVTYHQGPDTVKCGAVPGRCNSLGAPRSLSALCSTRHQINRESYSKVCKPKQGSNPKPALVLCYLHLAMFNSRSQFLVNWAWKLFEQVRIWLAVGKPWVVISCSCYLAAFTLVRVNAAGLYQQTSLLFRLENLHGSRNDGPAPWTVATSPVTWKSWDGLVVMASSRMWALPTLVHGFGYQVCKHSCK